MKSRGQKAFPGIYKCWSNCVEADKANPEITRKPIEEFDEVLLVMGDHGVNPANLILLEGMLYKTEDLTNSEKQFFDMMVRTLLVATYSRNEKKNDEYTVH